MKKITLLLVAVGFVLTSCGGGGGTRAPSNLDNACSIKNQRKSWFKDMERTERRWGVPVSVQMATIYQESKFDGKARTPFKWKAKVIPMGRQSSAYGFSQALDGTWDWYRDETGKRGAKRDRFSDAVDFMGWYMDQSSQKLGISKSNAYAQYLAYHDGHTGYRRGTYKKKKWLVAVARSVQDRAILYDAQLRRCR
ncbi:hypothetical protein GCM10007939_17040 [Amylibacter marinus]|uniref:Transglycosylase SLT domain-containing protein n=1 Tax=Amylibacter marinus TaxID=1475483 RepID=A0ABQ5VW28_9RHOB|nr:hypothetical protein [Amylibacter marinus]GLQ35421.1 hypothetical protein GCM10007939_17040 [Amylibacter marinus]